MGKCSRWGAYKKCHGWQVMGSAVDTSSKNATIIWLLLFADLPRRRLSVCLAILGSEVMYGEARYLPEMNGWLFCKTIPISLPTGHFVPDRTQFVPLFRFLTSETAFGFGLRIENTVESAYYHLGHNDLNQSNLLASMKFYGYWNLTVKMCRIGPINELPHCSSFWGALPFVFSDFWHTHQSLLAFSDSWSSPCVYVSLHLSLSQSQSHLKRFPKFTHYTL
jgi:hypothetical protein